MIELGFKVLVGTRQGEVIRRKPPRYLILFDAPDHPQGLAGWYDEDEIVGQLSVDLGLTEE